MKKSFGTLAVVGVYTGRVLEDRDEVLRLRPQGGHHGGRRGAAAQLEHRPLRLVWGNQDGGVGPQGRGGGGRTQSRRLGVTGTTTGVRSCGPGRTMTRIGR